MKTPYVWHRTGVVVVLVAGFILLAFLLIGPLVYAGRRVKAYWTARRRTLVH